MPFLRPRYSLAACTIFLAWFSFASGAMAQTSSRSGKPAGSSSALEASSVSGSFTDGLYSNLPFAFSYKTPFGWVDRTDSMREDAAASSSAGPSKSQVLLAVFERPPEATADHPNSAVIIAAESVDSYPGLKSAAGYFGPLTEVITSRGFKVTEPPYEVLLGGRTLVRGDFIKEAKGQSTHQATLALLTKGYVVSFTFIGASEDDVTELMEGLNLGQGQKTPATPKK